MSTWCTIQGWIKSAGCAVPGEGKCRLNMHAWISDCKPVPSIHISVDRYLGQMYMAEAQVAMDHIADAVEHLDPSSVTDVSVLFPEQQRTATQPDTGESKICAVYNGAVTLQISRTNGTTSHTLVALSLQYASYILVMIRIINLRVTH